MNKNDKLKIYKGVLIRLYRQLESEKKYNSSVNLMGMCTHIIHESRHLFKLELGHLTNSSFMGIFHELKKHQPRTYSTYWFSLSINGHNKRVEIIKDCINQLENS